MKMTKLLSGFALIALLFTSCYHEDIIIEHYDNTDTNTVYFVTRK